MEHAGNLAATACANVRSALVAPVTNAIASPLSAERPRIAVLRRLWGRMVTLYGHAWSSVNGVSPEKPNGGLTLAGDTWSRALAGITDAQIAAAIGQCMVEAAEYAPKPGVFKAMCLQIPTLEEVADQLIARRGEVSRFARKVWDCIRDPYEFRTAPAPRQEALLRGAYARAREWVMAGKPLPEQPVAVVEHHREPKRFAPNDQVQAKLRDLLARL